MAGTHLTPPLRRLAIFLVAIALVAAISPGLAIAAANGAPKPVLDVITTAENTPINGNVLDNDINLGSGTLTVTGFVALAPSIGTLTIEADGDFLFTPADHWTGTTTTTYEVSNDSHSHDGDIQITVTPINEAPDAVNDTATVDEDTPTDVTAQLLANDTDPDGDTLVVSAASNPTGGSVDVTSNVVTFTPASRILRRRHRLLRLRHQRRQRRHRQRQRDGQRQLHQRRTRCRRRQCLGHRGHAGDDRSGRPPDQRHRCRYR